jgi:histidinol-phosphate/aromatic aminotransferase/cobyric acid decarboxylase-like protein
MFSKILDGLEPYFFQKNTHLTYMDLNEYDFDHHPDVIEKFKNSINCEAICKYGSFDQTHYALVNIIAEYLEISPEQVMLTNGCDAAIKVIIESCNYDTIHIHEPAYRQYHRMSNIAGKTTVFHDEYHAYMSFQPNKHELVFICSPSQPSGLYHHHEIMHYVDTYPEVTFVIDETYIDYLILTGQGKSLATYTKSHPNLIVLKSMSKSFGLAGIRVGYLVSSADNIKQMSKICNHKDVTYLSKVVALSVMQHLDWYVDKAYTMYQMRDKICGFLQENREPFTKTVANFILLPNPLLYQFLYDNGIVIRKLPSGTYRLTVPSEQNTLKLLNVLTKYYVSAQLEIWCICLSDRDDKYDYVNQHLRDNGLHDVKWYRPIRDPRGGEFGCWESHKYCIKNTDKPYALVFEDDVKFTQPIDWLVIYNTLKNHQFDTFFLGGTLMGMVKRVDDDVWEVLCNQAHAYIVKKEIADRIDFTPNLHQGGVDDYYRLHTKQLALINPICLQKGGFITDNKWYRIDLFQNVFQNKYLYEFLQSSGNIIAKTLRFLPVSIQPYVNPIPCLLMVNITVHKFLSLFL